MIHTKEIVLKYGKKQILNSVSCAIKEGRITAFIGKSGAGKTSLLRCVAGLEKGYEGEISLCGNNLKALPTKQRASSIGFVFQQFHLFPHMTILDNCMQPLQIALGQDASSANANALETLSLLNMECYAKAYPAQLSGGQQQRAAIARALSLKPKVLLFDEPTSALDPENGKILQQLFLRLSAMGVTIAFSSHDMGFINGVLDCVYFLEEGKVVEYFDKVDGYSEGEFRIKNFVS